MEEEIWKPVPSYEGVIASSLGRIKFPEVEGKTRGGGKRIYKTKPTYGNICKSSKNARHLYRGMFHKKLGNLKVHRLVCEAFHGPAPIDKQIVIHLDEDSLNNCPENLKWGSQKENLNMPKFVEYCKSRTRENSAWAKHKKNK